ncbi:DUF2145 domain-containing protein [Pelomonas sp. KK5]|uniref:DUF2145 domain-containing protein n=1 Tax=Pelomonas sp. KK5 TaxID=1855730 RepID=UPI001E459F32|nr:DUF2145 domain-containing protein [Pelomonas sp. KK5]
MKSWLLAGLACLAAGAAQADSLRFCDRQKEPNAAEQDALLRFAAIVKQELAASGQDLALVSRSGLHLERIGQRYSHAGFSLKASANGPWSVRQLYYACDEKKPRIFDQGMAGFVLGTADVEQAYLSLVFLPPEASAALEQAARDDRRALALLGANYSANAYPFSQDFQNCNQWVAEMLAQAWGSAAGRADAQQWLQAEHYAPTDIQLGPLMLLGLFVPWVHGGDHPQADKAAGRYRVSMPASLEVFVHEREPQARRVELCRSGTRIVIHRGWSAIAEGCVAGEGDEQLML